MKELFDLLSFCRNNDIHFSLNAPGKELKIRGNIKILTQDQLTLLQLQKQAIINILQNARATYMPVQPLPPQAHYELSAAQKRIWVLSRLGGGTAYHISLTNVFEGKLQTVHLAAAFEQLIARHEILRTVFKEDETGNIKQYILPASSLNFSIAAVDLRPMNDPGQEADRLLREAKERPFDTEKGPLLRAGLLQCADEYRTFYLVIHHIICDGWSMDILIRELMQSYAAHCSGKNELPAPLPFQYKDFASWQQQQLTGETYAAHRAYWMRQFEGILPVLQLPGQSPRPAIKTYNGAATTVTVPAGDTSRLKALLQQQDSTLFMGLLTLVQMLLYRYTAQNDIIIGTPVAGRELAALEDQLGLYMNTVALRCHCRGTDSFLQWLAATKLLVIQAQIHQAYPFDWLVDELNLQQDRSRNPLFDVMVTLQEDSFSQQGGSLLPGQLHIVPGKPREIRWSKFDWTFHFVEGEHTIQLELTYNSDLYSNFDAGQLSHHLLQLLTAIVENPSMTVDDLPMLSQQEIQQLLIGFNETHAAFPQDKTVVDLFTEQARQTPGTTALVFGNTTFTYAELQERTDQLATQLVTEHAIEANSQVAVMLDRSADMIIAILAILKAGGAYVSIDPDYPAARIAYILQDCGARILLTASHYLPQLSTYEGSVISLDQPAAFTHHADTFVPANILPADLAYVIYTSGSTGQPKGVMITHRSLVDYFYGILQRTNISGCRQFGLVSTIAADLGNTVIYTSLLMGGTLHIYSASDLADPEKIFTSQLDCLKIVPSHWKSLQWPGKLFIPKQCLIFGGESLTSDVLETISKGNHTCQVYNHYGPSETTIGKLIYPVDLNRIPDPVPLGSPFCQSSFFILDAQHRLVPVGVVGEICISGAGLARGYWQKPALTAERFVDNPYKEGTKMYKTGDLGRWLPDGNIEFTGRKDDQVKIRGYRVEPGEIEATIVKHPDIEAAVVQARNNTGGEKELVAWLVTRKQLSLPDMRIWLGQALPAWMIPAHFVLLEKLPLTLNGKIDKLALPAPETNALINPSTHIAPRNAIEEQLTLIWQELLRKDTIGMKDNFFELGGHSLKMMQLLSRINRHFAIRMNIQSIFREPTIESIGEQVLFILDQQHRQANRKNLIQVEI